MMNISVGAFNNCLPKVQRNLLFGEVTQTLLSVIEVMETTDKTGNSHKRIQPSKDT